MSDSFLSRWARRKESVRAAARVETPAPGAAVTLDRPQDAAEAPASAEGVAAEQEPALKELLDTLPSLDSLTPESDLTAFLQAGVPSALRNAALRRMWSVDPSIRDFVSEAREYAYDWNIPGAVPGFGPLLPSDDVKAMLKRVVDGVLPQTKAEPDEDSSETDQTSPEAPIESVAAAPREPQEPQESQELREPAVIAVAEIPERPSSDLQPESAEAIPDRPLAARSAPVIARLRRHGGAMPT